MFAHSNSTKAIMNVLWWKNAIRPAKQLFSDGGRKRMLIKISLEQLLAESSRLQDHRQRNCVIRSVIVESAILSGHHVKTNVDVNIPSRYVTSDLINSAFHPSTPG